MRSDSHAPDARRCACNGGLGSGVGGRAVLVSPPWQKSKHNARFYCGALLAASYPLRTEGSARRIANCPD